MKRIFILVLLGVGALSGFAHGFHVVRHGYGPWGQPGHCAGEGHRSRHVQELADACVRASREQATDVPAGVPR